MRIAEVTPVGQATGVNVSLAASVPWGIFGIGFGIILVAFLVWYVFNRRAD